MKNTVVALLIVGACPMFLKGAAASIVPEISDETHRKLEEFAVKEQARIGSLTDSQLGAELVALRKVFPVVGNHFYAAVADHSNAWLLELPETDNARMQNMFLARSKLRTRGMFLSQEMTCRPLRHFLPEPNPISLVLGYNVHFMSFDQENAE